MLRARFSQCTRGLAPTSASSSSLLHTSAVLRAATSRKHIARAVKKENNVMKEERWRKANASRPSVVLGTRIDDNDIKWANCDLAKILVDEQELITSTELQPTQQPVGTVHLPKQLGFGVGEQEKRMLFQDLPILSAEASAIGLVHQAPAALAAKHAEGTTRELLKANAFAKVLDLRNASAGGIAYENRRRIILAFSGPENSFDPGRSEVQAALLTYKIRNLWTHLTNFRRDIGNRRGLRKLVHERAKILKYLKGLDRDRYDTVLERLALEPASVEGELVV